MTKTMQFLFLLLVPYVVCAQTGGTGDHDSRKPARREEWQKYSIQIDGFKKIARSAYSDEQSRQKAGDCPKAVTTYDMNMCLGAEVEKTKANYRRYIDALRSIEELESPDDTSTTGPSGAPLTQAQRAREFDAVESAWQAYQKAQCLAAYDAYKGGTIAPIVQVTCELRLLRDHMSELESIYDATENR